MELQETAWTRAPDELFASLCDRPGAFLLESALEAGGLGRYSFIGFDPFLVLESRRGVTWLKRAEGEETVRGDVLTVLRGLLDKYRCAARPEIPFAGGAVGFISYEFGARLEKVESSHPNGSAGPEVVFGFYDGILMFDHRVERVFMVADPVDKAGPAEIFRRLNGALEESSTRRPVPPAGKAGGGEPKPCFQKNAYLASIARIKDYIAAGDVYQVNLTQRFEAGLACHPYELYQRLRRRSPAPFASYLNTGSLQIVSSSPERFLRVRDGTVETRPIKGTRPRGTSAAEDLRLRDELLASEKDRAELLMIVDLERNDLGRVCEPGSIQVSDLFKLETHPTLHHLVANVSGRLRSECGLTDCLKALLPGGSITGAPKVRAMQIIAELETGPRGVYTGGIGYLGFDGNCDFAIAIRTILCAGGRASYHAGGGIVWDSDPECEYQEILHKGAAMRAALME